MIFLLGGTTEAPILARALTQEGHAVLLSMATPIPPRGELGPGVRLRCGMLDAPGLETLLRAEGITAVVDATHPYAETVSDHAWSACQRTGIPYLAYDRPSTITDGPFIHRAADHAQAAECACSFGRTILLTLGVRNLAPYIEAAQRSGLALVARVLEQPSSVEACFQAGLAKSSILCANGPFSVEENRAHIMRYGAGVLVTKDSGEAGGVDTKIEAARACGCEVVVVTRPPRPAPAYATMPALLAALRRHFVVQT